MNARMHTHIQHAYFSILYTYIRKQGHAAQRKLKYDAACYPECKKKQMAWTVTGGAIINKYAYRYTYTMLYTHTHIHPYKHARTLEKNWIIEVIRRELNPKTWFLG